MNASVDPCGDGPEPRVWVEIDLDQVQANFRAIAAAVAPLGVMAVLKANAYGLGMLPIARALHQAGAAAFGVAELREALALRELGLPVQVLGGLIPAEIPPAVRHGVTVSVTDVATAQHLSAAAVAAGRTAVCHFLVDTGMGRLGIPESSAIETITTAARLPGLQCEGIFTHFPMAYGEPAVSAGQVARFVGLLRELAARDVHFGVVHIANSDGINNVPASITSPFTMVRTGINLYGVFDLEGQQALPLQPVLALKTRLIAARSLPAGTTIGYGCTYRLPQRERIGTIAAGYADGLPLALSNAGSVLIRGRRCPVRGRVSMDYTTVSLDDVPEAEVGDEVVCLGGDIPVREWAAAKGTITYEIICSIGNRVARRYLSTAMRGEADARP